MIGEEPESADPTQRDAGEKFVRPQRTWKRKFQDAFQGLRQSVQEQSSYRVHFIFTFLVIIAGAVMRFDTTRWSILVLCIVVVLAGEMLNTSIETLSRAVTENYNEHIGKSLNIASGAILVLSIGAAIVGTVLFVEAALKWIF